MYQINILILCFLYFLNSILLENFQIMPIDFIFCLNLLKCRRYLILRFLISLGTSPLEDIFLFKFPWTWIFLILLLHFLSLSHSHFSFLLFSSSLYILFIICHKLVILNIYYICRVVAYTEVKRRQSLGPVLPISLKDQDSKSPLLK